MSYTVQNKEDFEQELIEAGNKLVVIDFFANWCGPCKIISPILEELSLKYANTAKILKVNIDDCEEIAMEYNVTSMPTFVFIKDQQVVDVVVGGNSEKLVKNLDKYAKPDEVGIQRQQQQQHNLVNKAPNDEYNANGYLSDERLDVDDYQADPGEVLVVDEDYQWFLL